MMEQTMRDEVAIFQTCPSCNAPTTNKYNWQRVEFDDRVVWECTHRDNPESEKCGEVLGMMYKQQ